ncbi:MAG: AAA family ATPase, partial [Myxococcota bacterium]
MTRHLPRPATSFIGRHSELEDLKTIFSEGGRLVTTWGPAGVGKTRLALEYAHRSTNRYPGGVWMVALAEISELADFCNALSKSLGIPLGTSDPVEILVERLSRRKRCLVVLDNFDRLVTSTGRTVQTLLERVGTLDCLVTSRQRLRVPLEKTLELGSMNTGAADGVTLFVDRVRQTLPSFEPNADEIRQIERIVERLNGLPLGIEIAAARTDLLVLGGIETRLNDHLLEMNHQRPFETAQETLRDTIAWSWELLDESAQSVLVQASVFAGPFTLEAAESVIETETDIIAALGGLRDRSLLLARGEGRFQCYASVRQFAWENGAEALRKRATQSHRVYYLELAEGWLRELDGPTGQEALEKMVGESDNIRAIAFQPTETRACWSEAARAAIAIRELWMSHGPLARYVALLDRLVDDAPEDETEYLGQLHLARGACCRIVGEADRAQRDVEKAESLLQGAPHLLMRVLNELGVIHHQRREVSEAHTYYERALAQLDAAHDPGFRARITGNLGALAHDAGDFEEAQTHYEAALQGLRRLRMTRLEAIYLTNLA